MAKHFLVNKKISHLDKREVESVQQERSAVLYESRTALDKLAQEVINEKDTLKCVEGRVIVKVDNNSKDFHTFEDGTRIARLRRFNNLNLRETNPVNAWVIDAEDIPVGVEVLVHHNSIHDSNRVFSYKDKSPDVAYYSILIQDCFLWRDENNVWQPVPPYETALRVFEPYKGVLEGVEPKVVPDVLYVTSGPLKGNIVKTLKACDFEVIFQGVEGREQRIIRFRPTGDEKGKREPEAIAILDEYNKRLKKKDLLVGLSASDCNFI